MVHQNSETTFDFDREGIRARSKATGQRRGTTLGADNGSAWLRRCGPVQQDLPHPALEVLLNIDEEIR